MLRQLGFVQELPFQISSSHIQDLFLGCAQQQTFQVLEQDKNQIIVIKENVAVLKNILKKAVCLTEDHYEQVCLVKLQIETNQVKCVRIVSLKPITGSVSVNGHLIDQFSRAINKLLNNKSADIINDASEFVGFVNVSEEMENPANQNPYYLETSAYYMFHKLLCASNYGLGKKVADYILEMQKNLDKASLISLKKNVQSLNSFINQIVETLFQSFNFGKQETSQIMPYCRISIEKYFYLKLSNLIIPQYYKQFRDQDHEFKDKTERISEEHAFQLLEIPQFSESQKLRMHEAIQELDKIDQMTYPREKLRCLQMMNAILKATFPGLVDSTNKYCLIFSAISHPYAELQFLIDATSSQDKVFLHKLQLYLDEIMQNF